MGGSKSLTVSVWGYVGTKRSNMEFFQNETIQVRITHTPKLIPSSDVGYLKWRELLKRKLITAGKLVLWNVFLFSLCSSCYDIQFISSSPCFPGAERIFQPIGPVWEREITINSGSSGVSRGAAHVAFCGKELFLCSCSELKVRLFKIDLQWLYIS